MFKRLMILAALLLSGCNGHSDINCESPDVLDVFKNLYGCDEIMHCGKVNARDLRELSKLSADEYATRIVGSAALSKMPDWMAEILRDKHRVWTKMLEGMKLSSRPIDFDPNKKRYTCQASMAFDPELYNRAMKIESTLTALQDQTIAILASQPNAGADQKTSAILQMTVAGIEPKIRACIPNPYRRNFTVQPTQGNEFLVNLLENEC